MKNFRLRCTTNSKNKLFFLNYYWHYTTHYYIWDDHMKYKMSFTLKGIHMNLCHFPLCFIHLKKHTPIFHLKAKTQHFSNQIGPKPLGDCRCSVCGFIQHRECWVFSDNSSYPHGFLCCAKTLMWSMVKINQFNQEL